MVIYSKRSPSTRKSSQYWRKMKFGAFLYRLFKDWKRYTTQRFCTEISSQLMCSSIVTAVQNSETWTFQKLRRRGSCILRLEHHTTPRQRFGRTSPTMQRVTFGRWVAYCMSQLLWDLLLEQRIWLASTKESLKAFTQKYPVTSLETLIQPLKCFWLCSRRCGQAARKF